MLKKIADTFYNVGYLLFSVLYTLAAVTLLTAFAVYLTRHISCINVFDKVCFIY